MSDRFGRSALTTSAGESNKIPNKTPVQQTLVQQQSMVKGIKYQNLVVPVVQVQSILLRAIDLDHDHKNLALVLELKLLLLALVGINLVNLTERRKAF